MYLWLIFDLHHQFFTLVTRQLLTLSILVDQLLVWSRSVNAAQRHVEEKSSATTSVDRSLGASAPGTFREHLNALSDMMPSQMSDPSRNNPTPRDLVEVWRHLCESDVCVVPSTMRMGTTHTLQEW